VTDSGQVRLLDFGWPKLLEQEEEHTELTQVYGRAATPEYASPDCCGASGWMRAERHLCAGGGAGTSLCRQPVRTG